MSAGDAQCAGKVVARDGLVVSDEHFDRPFRESLKRQVAALVRHTRECTKTPAFIHSHRSLRAPRVGRLPRLESLEHCARAKHGVVRLAAANDLHAARSGSTGETFMFGL